jgi:hypothetical protein
LFVTASIVHGAPAEAITDPDRTVDVQARVRGCRQVGVGGGALGSGVLNAIDAYGFPNLRTFSFQISTSF